MRYDEQPVTQPKLPHKYDALAQDFVVVMWSTRKSCLVKSCPLAGSRSASPLLNMGRTLRAWNRQCKIPATPLM